MFPQWQGEDAAHLVKSTLPYLETEDYGPDESECETVVSINDVV